jgi:hypothetical protein
LLWFADTFDDQRDNHNFAILKAIYNLPSEYLTSVVMSIMTKIQNLGFWSPSRRHLSGDLKISNVTKT